MDRFLCQTMSYYCMFHFVPIISNVQIDAREFFTILGSSPYNYNLYTITCDNIFMTSKSKMVYYL